MALIDVKYVMAEDLTEQDRKELNINVDNGLIAIESTNPTLSVKGTIIKDYVENLLNLGEENKKE
jgi:hypothetical protein